MDSRRARRLTGGHFGRLRPAGTEAHRAREPQVGLSRLLRSPRADRQAGITPAFRQGESPTGQKYTWHHVEDGETMQLVPIETHSETGHSGGADLIRRGLAPRKGG